jgi:hypothetical protein
LDGAVLGWFGAYLQFRYSFKKGLRKEHYYQSKENVITIFKLNSEFLDCIYKSYKSIKTALNTGSLVSSDVMNDFITEYQSKLALFYQMSKIEFPAEAFDLKTISELLRQLEDNIAQMNHNIIKILEDNSSVEFPTDLFKSLGSDCVESFNRDNKGIIDAITQEIVLYQNKMIRILQLEAKELDIIAIAK